MLLPTPSSLAAAALALVALGLASSAEASPHAPASSIHRRSTGGLSSTLLSKVKSKLASHSADTYVVSLVRKKR